jgi:EAL domain-containing protein (putative c-di-GMP-specific phosphodiesterase class I)
VSEVKIDRSFTSRIGDDRDDQAIVRSIIDLGRDLGLRVVAEGVAHEQTRYRAGPPWQAGAAAPAGREPGPGHR